MATTQTDVRVKTTGATVRPPSHAPRNSRRNEIIAIALLAVSALLVLCMLSYSSFDPSWNASGQGEARNLVGRVGANVSAALFQTFGFAALLVPALMLAAAWRRFRTRRIHAPLARVVGLLLLVFAVAALLDLYVPRESFGGGFESGGVVGVLVADGLRGMVNTVGSTILLPGQRDAHREDISRVETRVHTLESRKAAQQHARADEQHERQRDLGHDERAAKSATAEARR